MKQVFHKLLAMVMAFVVLFSTLSFTINMHYCGNTLVDIAVFQKAKGCGMEMQNPATKGCSISQKGCCDDKQALVYGQDELQIQINKISLDQQVFLVSYIYSYVHLFEGIDQNVTLYKAYKPPIVIRQLYKLDETYLI